MKSADRISLSHGSLVRVTEETEKFAKTEYGYIPKQHLCKVEDRDTAYVETAKLFLGTPYLWGGNSNTGIDCSGLVQAALTASGIPCPGDSDQQEKQLGKTVSSNSRMESGDLIFWKGHIALAVDANTLIRANAFHTACAYEPLHAAIKRIKTKEAVTSRHTNGYSQSTERINLRSNTRRTVFRSWPRRRTWPSIPITANIPCLSRSFGRFSIRYIGFSAVRRKIENTATSRNEEMP